MPLTIRELSARIRDHRCYRHPLFEHWAEMAPSAPVLGALFHQLQKLAAATRDPGGFPAALCAHGLLPERQLAAALVPADRGQGAQLAAMAGHVVNRALDLPAFRDLTDRRAVESWLKLRSDELLGRLPGYSPADGLTPQARRTLRVLDRPLVASREEALFQLGSALALEIIAGRQLIPGLRLALVDSGLYAASLEEPEMRWLREHCGELGAEPTAEGRALTAVEAVLQPATEACIERGAAELLDALRGLWDVLDASLLQSGVRAEACIA